MKVINFVIDLKQFMELKKIKINLHKYKYKMRIEKLHVQSI
jgi:hypothetical protein